MIHRLSALLILACATCVSSKYFSIPLHKAPESNLRNHHLRSTGLIPMTADSYSQFQSHYYINVTIGGTDFQLIADTGSTDMAVPLSSCTQVSSNEPGCPSAGGGDCSAAQTLQLSADLGSVSCQLNPKCINTQTAATYCTNAGAVAGTADFESCQKRFNTVYDPSSWCGACNGENIKGFANGCCVAEAYGIGCHVGWRGMVIQDQVSISGLSGAAFFSGIVQLIGNPFSYNPVPQGILGLAFPTLSAAGSPSVVSQLLSENNGEQLFAMCIGPSSGALFLGGYDETVVNGDLVAVDLVQEQTENGQVSYRYFNVNLESYQIGTSAAVANTYIVLVDSGTPQLVLPPAVFSYVTDYLNENFCATPTPNITTPAGVISFSCTVASPSTNVPAFLMAFSGGVSINVFEYVSVTANGSRWDLQAVSQVGLKQVILGAAFMTPFLTVFDWKNTQVSFGTRHRGSCESGFRTPNLYPVPQPLTAPKANFFLSTAGFIVIGVLCGLGGGLLVGGAIFLITALKRTKTKKMRGIELTQTRAVSSAIAMESGGEDKE